MSDQPTLAVFQHQLDAAWKLYSDGDIKGCITLGKENLRRPIPHYFVIMNCILVASALDDWAEADGFRLTAEQSYRSSLKDAEERKDAYSLDTLSNLRTQLDEPREFIVEDIAGLKEEEQDAQGVVVESEQVQEEIKGEQSNDISSDETDVEDARTVVERQIAEIMLIRGAE